MKDIEGAVSRHYGDADLLTKIFAGLEASGVDLSRLMPDDLAPVDEFHIGGRAATAYAVAKMPIDPEQHILDVGCGLGGTARFIAAQAGATVTGIDLTPEYIAVANKLTGLTGLGDRVTHEVANALAMPYEDGTFDGAITVHVAMNIHDRAGLYGEIARVLKPGATFCVFDVMKKGDEDIAYPVPWAETAETSHLTSPEEMQELLGDAGFDLGEVEDRTEFALDFFRKTLAAAADGPPPLGTHLLLGPNMPEKRRNMLSNIENGRIAPVLMIARRRAP